MTRHNKKQKNIKIVKIVIKMSNCKFTWYNLPNKIKNKIEPYKDVLSKDVKNIYYFNLPNKLNNLYKELSEIKPECAVDYVKFIWFNLPNKVKALCELVDCEEPTPFNFYLRISGTDMYDNYGIEDEGTFISYLSGEGLTNIAVTDFYLSADTLRCNLSFDGATGLSLSTFGISKIINLDSLVNLANLFLDNNQLTTIENLDSLVNLDTLFLSENQLTTIENLDSLINLTNLYLSNNQLTAIENLDALVNLTYLDLRYNQLTTIENLDSLVNLTSLGLGNNQLTTTEFNKLNSWAILAPNNGTIYASNNIDNFNLSTTYTTLLAKGWTINT